jgi:hypothetical protein
MKELESKIKDLKEKGFSYNKIKSELNCSKSTISYHLGNDQKLKAKNRVKKYRSNPNSVLSEKIYRFRWRSDKNVMSKIRDFQRRDNSLEKGSLLSTQPKIFTIEDFLLKIGDEHKCYLSGEPINIYNPIEYSIDHIIPASKNGDNSIENAGLISLTINKMKDNLTVEEFINKCIQILKYNGYKVTK